MKDAWRGRLTRLIGGVVLGAVSRCSSVADDGCDRGCTRGRRRGAPRGRCAALAPARARGCERAPSGPRSHPDPRQVAAARRRDVGLVDASAGDPLVSNGLGSPLCARAAGEGELSQASESNCRTSGFEAAPAPTGNYAFDVHINTGVTKVTNDAGGDRPGPVPDGVDGARGGRARRDRDARVVLHDRPARQPRDGRRGRGLRQTQAAFTQPWLVLVLAVASVLALYHGLVRRRVAETVGQALLMLAMMAGGLWVITDPAGTVGALGQWANQAGLGTLGAVAGRHARAIRSDAGRQHGRCLRGGDRSALVLHGVRQRGLVPRSRAAGPAAARGGAGDRGGERAQIGCRVGHGSAWRLRAARQRAGDARLSQSAVALREARTQRRAVPRAAREPGRRATRSTTRARCSTCSAGAAKRPAGAHGGAGGVSHRARHGWRFMGLVFIWVGALGMLLLLGFIALHLLARRSPACSICCWRRRRCWRRRSATAGGRLFADGPRGCSGAVMSKLMYSFLLGVVLLIERILTADLTALGWLTQWLLMSAMWWGAFCHRHQVLGFGSGRSQLEQSVACAPRGRCTGDAARGDARRGLGQSASSPSRPGAWRAQRAGRGRSRAREGRQRGAGGSHARAGASRSERHRCGLRPGRRSSCPTGGPNWSVCGASAAGRSRGRPAPGGRTGASRAARRRGDRALAARTERGAALGERRRARAARERAGCTRARRRRSASGSWTPRRRCRAHGLAAEDRANGVTTPALAGLAGYGRDEYERLDSREPAGGAPRGRSRAGAAQGAERDRCGSRGGGRGRRVGPSREAQGGRAVRQRARAADARRRPWHAVLARCERSGLDSWLKDGRTGEDRQARGTRA